MFETRRQRPISRAQFARRILAALGLAACIATIAMLVGIVGYHYIGELSWIDALHNSAMILSGMGLVSDLSSDAAKIFSSAYALFCGLVFVSVIAITLTPIMHRVLHKFHLGDDDFTKSSDQRSKDK